MESVLQRVFPQATSVIADSDLMGAAIALYGHRPGIACILGTGANSGLYDGTCIVAHTNPMGYILGDEGSGASLGKNFLNLLYKNHLPPALLHEFESSTGLTYAQVIQRVYREPLAARFLASLSPFIHDHLHVPALRAMVSDLFQSFFRLHIAPYRATLKASEPLTVGFVGSVAYYYRDLLEEAAKAEGFALGTVLRQAL
jgi:N-acetylglucosamine kinase-like BadF-type ATPase